MITFTSFTPKRPRADLVLKSGYKPPAQDRPVVRKARAKFKAALARLFKAKGKELAKAVRDGLSKAETDPPATLPSAQTVVAAAQLEEWGEAIAGVAQPYLTTVAVDAGAEVLGALGITDPVVIAAMRQHAKAWAKHRAAELVGRKWVEGVLVGNPSARWAITESTRNALRDLVENALANGASPGELAAAIEDGAAFSGSRAAMVSRTEMALADGAGTVEGFRAAPGVAGKAWLPDADPCVVCQGNADEGGIPIDQTFSSGDDTVPAHPNCECALVPVFDDEM